jgi:hypothetical protein
MPIMKGGKHKRVRTEDESELETSLMETLDEFNSKTGKTVDDFGSIFTALVTTILSDRKRISELESEVTNLENSVKKISEQFDKNEEIINTIQQEKIERDVFVSGIVTQPKNDLDMAKKIVKAYGGSMVDVTRAYSFKAKIPQKKQSPQASSTPNKHKFSYNMVITFVSLDKKILFLQKKKIKGLITNEQLFNEQLSDDSKNSTVKIVSRLTKFNLIVFNKLMMAKGNEQWEKLQLRNGTFRVKKNKESKWEFYRSTTSLNMLKPVSTINMAEMKSGLMKPATTT